MDNLWQRHRTFILKILAGLGVCLFAWIIGSSLSGGDFDQKVALAANMRREIRQTDAPATESTSDYREAAEVLRNRILPVANAVGETRTDEDLRRGLLKELLEAVGKDPAADFDAYLALSRQSAQACVTRLVGDAATALRKEAARKNVFIDENLGFDKREVTSSDLDRYLLTLKNIVHVVRMGIEEGAYEVREIGILQPPGGRFAGEKTFIREYPYSVEYRAPTGVLLRLLARMNDPQHFVPMSSLRRFQSDRQGRDEDVMVMTVELKALRILPTESL